MESISTWVQDNFDIIIESIISGILVAIFLWFLVKISNKALTKTSKKYQSWKENNIEQLRDFAFHTLTERNEFLFFLHKINNTRLTAITYMILGFATIAGIVALKEKPDVAPLFITYLVFATVYSILAAVYYISKTIYLVHKFNILKSINSKLNEEIKQLENSTNQ